jgi:hypothetical protein
MFQPRPIRVDDESWVKVKGSTCFHMQAEATFVIFLLLISQKEC